MDERIEILSSALSLLSDELGGKLHAGSSAVPSFAADKLAQANATSSFDLGVDTGRVRSELQAAQDENVQLREQVNALTAEVEDLKAATSVSGASKGVTAHAHAAPGSVKELQFVDLSRAGEEAPRVITPKAMKKARGQKVQVAKNQRRLSLVSTFKAQGQEKVGRMERMVELLTSISGARETEELISEVIRGVFGVLSPEVATVSLWVGALNKTFTAVSEHEHEESAELGSFFMKTVVDDSDAKVNVKRRDYAAFLGSKCHPDDTPQAVMCVPVFNSDRALVGVLEVRNVPHMGDYGADEEELLLPITAQVGVSFSNVLYNDRLHKALQQYQYSRLDMVALREQIADATTGLFQAEMAFLAVEDPIMKGTLTMVFNDKRTKSVPQGSGAVWTVYTTRVPLTLPALSSGNAAALRTEFNLGDADNGSLAMYPVTADGNVVGVLGFYNAGSAEKQLCKMFANQAGALLSNCSMYNNAMSAQDKVLNKLKLLDVSKSFAEELDQHKLIMTIIEKTRAVLDADRCALFILDEANEELWSQLHDGSIIKSKMTEGVVGWVAQNQKVLNIADAYSDARFNPEIDRQTSYHTHSILAVPVLDRDDKLTGVIQMINKRGGPFQPDDVEMCSMIASQAGVTLNNAQLFDEVKKDQQNFNVLLDISKKLSSEVNMPKLVKNIMDSARDLLNAERATLWLVDEEAQELWSMVADGLGEGMKELRIPKSAGIAGLVATSNATLNIPDAYSDSRFSRETDRKTGFRTRNILCTPINNSKGDILGVVQMINKSNGVFLESDENLLSAFTAQAAVSIENAQLFERAVEQGNFLKSVMDSITNLVVAFDRSGHLTLCNHSVHGLEKYFGLRQEAIDQTHLTYKQWLSAYPPLVEDITAVISNGCYKESSVPLEVKNEANKGEFSLQYTICPLKNLSSQGESTQTSKGCVLVFDDLSEQKMMKATLGRYLSGALVDQVLSAGNDVLGGVRQKVTVLFSDIRSFTTISESMDAVDLVRMLNDYFTYEIPPIFDNNGVLDKFIGDAIMAVFGVPFVSQNAAGVADGQLDAQNSCKCALEMIRELNVFNNKRIQTYGEGCQLLKIGIGLNTNLVVSGNIGSDKRMEYTVIGDGVNLASRLEGITKTYGVDVVMSEFTQTEVAATFITRELDLVAVKGKASGIRIYELVGAREVFADSSDVRAQEQRVGSVITYCGNPKILPYIADSERALALYREQKFDEAVALFQQILDATGDTVAKLFLQRCAEYVTDPPGSGWDGVYRPKSK
jgi:adenylate cyclase